MVEARYGSAVARARVEVSAPVVSALTIAPARSRLRVGQVAAFQALSRAGPVEAKWTSSTEAVLTQLDGNVFRAVARGKAWVCAAAGTQQACTIVGVQP
jgi:hypothetical protein